MTPRQPRFEIVRSDAGWFARVRGGNSRKVWQSEVYTRETAALNAFRVLGDLFGAGRAHVNDTALHVTTFTDGNGVGVLVLPIRAIDERTP
jgi:uncharacterized protein YegP (UPF0339 family)